jgi:DNA-binding CsgD family transcriptional regulator
MSVGSREDAVGRLAHLSRQGLDLASFWHAASDVLAGVVPHYMSPCWYTLDPDSLLITSHYSDDIAELPREWLDQEYFADDVNQLVEVARSGDRVSTLHAATGGDPASSPRWHQNMEYGGDQELIAALTERDGRTWGALGLYREPGQPMFDDREIRIIREAAGRLAEGARRALTLGEAKEPEGVDAPAIVILDRAWDVESATPTAGAWIDELPGGDWDRGRLPPSVLSVVSQASGDEGSEEGARLTTLARSGIWAAVTAEPLSGPRSGQVAVLIERASPTRIAPILMAAYGLTEREQELTRLVLQGDSTAAIARDLFISPHTVQEHLKKIFDKTGARSRRELTAKVFFTHYEPRVRDNESRAARDAFLRGGPIPADP